LRRSKISQPNPATKFVLGSYIFDYKNLSLDWNGDSKKLTQREADLLRYLIEGKNEVLRRSDIFEKIWGEDDYFLCRSLDVFISPLRKYLKQDKSLSLVNIHCVGFRLLDK